MEILLLAIRLILFAVFALAGVGKLLDLKGAEKAVKDFGTPEEFAKPFAIAIPFAEIVFAFCFLFPSTSWTGAIGGLVLLMSFSIGMIWQMAKGNAPDCHCFGQLHSEPVSRRTLVRNIIFSGLALFLAARGRDGQGPALAGGTSDSMQLILIFSVLVLMAAALFYLKRVLDNQGQILKRLDVLEVMSREGVPVDRRDAGHPQDGLPIGARFPDFELNDASGREVSLDSVRSNGLPSIFVFVSPTCEPCKALVPDLERWDAELGSRVNLVLMSSGPAEANADKFGVFSPDVVLQKNREVAEAAQARWTPTALFVRADGTVGSHIAAGDVAIRELIGKVREEEISNNTFFIRPSENGERRPKIGERIPQFLLEDIRGKTVTDGHLRGKRTLAVFWSLSCPHCNAMMSQLKEWDSSRDGADPDLIVFSDGDRAAHEALGLKAPIVLDAGYKTSEELGMFGTPSAVIVDESGTIITETATGASNIWALVGRKPRG